MEYYHQRPAMEVNYGKVAGTVIGLSVLFFFLQSMAPLFMRNTFALSGASVATHPWAILTHVFMHGGFYHLLMNMFGLFLFGFMLERLIGSRYFFRLFIASSVLAAVGQLMFTDPFIYSVGASGFLFGVLGMLGVLRPKMIIYVNFIPVPMALAVVGWAFFETFMIGAADSIGHAAHSFGLVVGVLYGLYFRKRIQ